MFFLHILLIQESPCTSSYLVMPSKNGVRKRRLYRCLYRRRETERNLAFELDHQLHLQETKQQRPFPETCLGRLPGEVRNMIYEHLLIFPPSQPTRYLRVPLLTDTHSNVSQAQGATMTTDSEAASAELPTQALGQQHRSAKASYVAILQTCRQVNREAYHIFYANNAFHFTNAPDLINFLSGIGPLRRAELTTLHLEGLVVDQPLCTKEQLDCLNSEDRKLCEGARHEAMHPDQHILARLLDGCRNLSRLRLEMRDRERFEYFLSLTSTFWTGKQVVYLVDGSRWIVRLPSTDDKHRALTPKTTEEIAAQSKLVVLQWNAYVECFPFQDTEGLFPVVVDIVRGTEEALGEGYQSWVAVRLP